MVLVYVNETATTWIHTYGHTLAQPDGLPISFVDHRRYHLDRPPPVIVGDGIDALAIEQLVAFRLVAVEAEREHAADRAIEVHFDRFEQVVRVRGNLRRPATGGIKRRRWIATELGVVLVD